jgi:ribosomal protein S18 acetylase RimI-like enzyme
VVDEKASGIRPIQLPADMDAIAEIGVRAFQYPENEAWSVQADEEEGILDMVDNLRRFWPLIWLLQFVSPGLRDIIRGYVWEEVGEPAGLVNFQRRGTTDTWYITTVAVVPEHRRRGIARKLVQVALDDIRERGGEMVLLSVINGNLPAYTLYEKLGFEHYSAENVLHCEPDDTPAQVTVPCGYEVSPLGFFDWRPRYQLEGRIIPDHVRRFEPVEEARFRQPAAARLFWPILQRAQGVRYRGTVVRTVADGQIVAWAYYEARVRPGGMNRVRLRIDPDHGELAPGLVQDMLRSMRQLSPGRRIELEVPRWQEALLQAAKTAGFAERFVYNHMALAL